jgi:hypothetical protein
MLSHDCHVVDVRLAPSNVLTFRNAAVGGPRSWGDPAHAYFVREASGWKLVGFERVPGGNPPANQRTEN